MQSARKSSLPVIDRGMKSSTPIIELDEVISHEGLGKKFVIDDNLPNKLGLESIKEVKNAREEFSN